MITGLILFLRLLLCSLLFCQINLVNGSLPISDYFSPIWELQPYNLIDTNPVCYHEGFCPMFPPGGKLSAFPNSEEKFQHILHNMHRMHANHSTDVDIGKWFWGANPNGGLVEWTSDDYCGTTSFTRKPLYWYSDANTAARFKIWDEDNCDSEWYKQTVDGTKLSKHYTCKWGLNKTEGGQVRAWGSGINNSIPLNRCPLFSTSPSDAVACSFNSRSGTFCIDSRDSCWFFTEGICFGNSCFQDSQCTPIFATYMDYVGKGFVEGVGTTVGVYSRFTEEIEYKLPIGTHYDQRMRVPSQDLNNNGKYFNLILEYFDKSKLESATNCYALYDGNYHDLPVLVSNHRNITSINDDFLIDDYSVFFRKEFYPPTSCQPYAFICKTENNNFIRLPEQNTYYFGTEWLDWDWTDIYNDYGYSCKENHYYYHNLTQEWIVNGGPTLNKDDIWYYNEGNTCIGCQKIDILDCWAECIYSDFAVASCNCIEASNTTTTTITGSPP